MIVPRRDADVIVAGAGPAGSITALLLARAGRDVLILDRAAFPRAKPCGDCLSLGATALFDELGLLDAVLHAAHARLDGWCIIAPDGRAFSSRFDDTVRTHRHSGSSCALAIERAVLDDVLLRAALDAGARFHRAAVTDVARDQRGFVNGVRTRTAAFMAPVTVGADGLRSVIAARLGARLQPCALRKLSLTFHLDMDPALPPLGEMHSGDGVCAGLAPVDTRGRCNLTIVADAHRFGRAVACDAHAFAAAVIASLPRLRGRIPPTPLHEARAQASGPFHRPVRRIAFNGAVLVGDAAGYYDPFTGQGVYQAIASARMLAPVIDDALRRAHADATAWHPYVRERAAHLRGARIVQRGIESVLSRPALANRAIARIAAAPAFARTILAVTGDTAPASRLLSPRVLAGLLFPLSAESCA